MTDIHIPSCYPGQTLQIACVWGQTLGPTLMPGIQIRMQFTQYPPGREGFYFKLMVQQKHLQHNVLLNIMHGFSDTRRDI